MKNGGFKGFYHVLPITNGDVMGLERGKSPN